MGIVSRGTRVRRAAVRLCVGGAVLCTGLAGLGTAGAQEELDAVVRPDVFRGSATAQVASAFLDRDAFLPVNDAFRFIALDGAGTYESSNQTARASIFYPGNGVVSGPNLACGTFGSQFPEQFSPVLAACSQYEYPLTVFADSLDPEGSSAGSLQMGSASDPISAKAVRAVARAALDGSATDAAMSELRVLGFPAGAVEQGPIPVPGAPTLDATVMTVENATSETDEYIDESGRLIVEAVATLDGVRLIGGLVEIDSIISTSSVVDDGRGEKSRHAELVVEGVTVGGVPAEVTDDGLVVGSPTGADGPLVQQLTGHLNDLVRTFGVRIHTLGVEDGVDDSGVAYARSGGVLVEFDMDVQGLSPVPGPQGDVDPNGLYRGVIELGATGVTGLAAHIEDPVFTPGGAATPDLGSAPVDPGSVSPSAPTVAGDPSMTDLPVGDQASSAGTSAAPGPRVVSISEVLSAGRVHLAYLAFTLMTFAVCVGPRFVLPARLPGSAS